MKFLIIAALVAVAAARPQDFHDDVFHFSSKVNHENLVRSSAVVVPQYQQQSVLLKSAPVYSQVHHHVVEQQQPSSVLFRSVEQEIPAVSTVHHVHQPAVYSQVAAVHHEVAAPIVAAPVVARTSYAAPVVARTHFAAPVVTPVAAPVVARTTFAAPQQYNQYNAQYSAQYVAEPKIKILKHVQEFDPSGIYSVDFQTENGISSAEHGTVKDIQAKEGPVAAKEGSYSYTGPDGQVYTVNWVADEFGYRASGAHLPVAPEVPAEIQRSLEVIASQPQKYDEDGNLVYKQQF